MAISLSFQPVSLGSVSAITPFAAGALVTTATRNAVAAETPSSIVSLSPQGRLLAATGTTETSPQTTASLTAQVIAVPQQADALEADVLAARRDTSAARISLQSLIDDPAQRAIANSRFNPVYSALLAAAHQADFMTPQALTRANAIPVDTPAPVLPVDRVDAISNYNQAAREFAHRQSPAYH
ncbi:hypothetical protein [Ferribacterium limneticum]|uniref:hypothetical protein n=1 Tax=Ferribacterium limneticum TaxID=76259 RepID=UPI001CF911BE|nr:hypothetical protein [Ferribacterium limneticum]UCV22001.1 hypothetical protein KI613_15910 [Ferribacterium limneticum]